MIRLVAMLMLMLAFACSARAGTVTCFTPGSARTCTEAVLQHDEFKSVVTEFLDPQDTGVGHAVSRLLWREIRDATSDLRLTGTILAADSGALRERFRGRDYLTFLATDYHRGEKFAFSFVRR